MLNGKVHRVRDKAHAMRVMMQRPRAIEIRAGRERDDRPQGDLAETAAAVRLLDHDALGPIHVARDDESGVSTQVEIPELMARAERSHEQLLRIPTRGIAAESRIG